MIGSRLVPVLMALSVPWAGATDAPGDRSESTRFKVFVESPGVYAVSHEELVEAGLGDRSVPTAGMGLTSRGTAIPVWVEDGDDGSFDPGDRFVFVGERLAGQYSYFDEFSRVNCYVLDIAADRPLRGADVSAADRNPGLPVVPIVRSRLEEDVVMVRYPERRDEPQERWFWERLAVTDRKPFRVTVGHQHMRPPDPVGVDADAGDLRDLTVVGASEDLTRHQLRHIFGRSGERQSTVRLRFGFRGWSNPRVDEGFPQHAVAVTVNGHGAGSIEWSGNEPYVHEMAVTVDPVVKADLDLGLRVSRRTVPDTDDLFVDVVLLNWIEVEYPRDGVLRREQHRFEVPRTAEGGTVELEAEASGWLYETDGRRTAIRAGGNRLTVPPSEDGRVYSVIGDAARRVDMIIEDEPSFLKTAFQQTDYIIITHRKLSAAVEPLAEYHRQRGLTVAVIDIEDIYDEFNHGIQNPRSVRDFLSWAFHNWTEPRPRFVLLAGDASWDFKNREADDSRYADWTYRPGEVRNFVKNASSAYERNAGLNHRNLVPTWSIRTSEGHAASDNWLACVDGDDIYPDFAIGRIPVTEPEEMAAVVEKTIAYDHGVESGDWQKRILFLTNESRGFQRASDRTAALYQERGYHAIKVYPRREETANEAHTRKILGDFDQGLLMVQFLGHGGRYIWRTGPPDLKKNHDLFTLEHLDQLTETDRLPFVISLTCYSAPFDHPTADSIGEKLLRLDGRGAIGVFAASWRNSPSSTMGRIVMDALTTPGATVGEAIMQAKRDLRNRTLVETYNLLGDPAVRIQVSGDVEPPGTEGEKSAQPRTAKVKSQDEPGTVDTAASSDRGGQPTIQSRERKGE